MTQSSCQFPSIELKTDVYIDSVIFYLQNRNYENYTYKADCIRNEISKIDRSKYPHKLAQLHYEIGRVYRDQNLNLEAFNAYFDCQVIIEDHHLQDTPTYALLCEAMGQTYYHFNEDERVIFFLKEYLSSKYRKQQELTNVNNTIGLSYRNLGQLDSSAFYFERALELARLNESKVWIGNISGNYAEIIEKKGDKERADKLREIDFKYSIEGGNYRSAANLMLREARCYFEKGNDEIALKRMTESFNLFSMSGDEYVPFQLYELRSKVNFNKGNFKEAAKDAFLADRIRDSVNREEQHLLLKRLEFQAFSNKKQSRIDELREKQEKRNQQILWLSSGAILLVSFLVILFFQQRSKQRKVNEIQRMKQNLYHEQLNTSKEQINSLVKDLRIRNKHIQELSEQVENIESTNQSGDQEVIEELKNNKILTEEDWVTFKRLFDQVYNGFFDRLLEMNNELTKAELRLAALIKLDLSPIEMSQTLGISKESVRKTNFRLRKKLGIDKPNELRATIVNT